MTAFSSRLWMSLQLMLLLSKTELFWSGGAAVLRAKLERLPSQWTERLHPRKFGNVLPGEIAACRQVSHP